MPDSRVVTNPSLAATISPDDLAWRAIVEATQDTHELLGELARDADGAVAFVGRPVQGGDYAILKLEPESSAGSAHRYSLFILHKLDETVPAPRIACSVCAALVASWRGTCPACGNAIGAGIDGPLPSDVSLAFHYYVTGQHDLVAEFPVGGYGPAAYLVRSRDQSHYSVLRLALGSAVTGAVRSYVVDAIPLNVAGAPALQPTREPLHIVGATEKIVVPRDVAATSSQTPAPASGSTTAGERVCPQCGATFGGATLFCPRDGASLRSVSSGGDLVGQLIDDRYHVGERLGEGGMGEVYIAQQVRTGRKCALKLMHVAMTRDADAVGRFRREASSACAISHPHVATIYDSGETLDHRPYFAMEFVDGRPLSSIIRDEGRLAPWRAADIARQIAEGLAAAHDIDIVHRDLKPDNVMLGSARGGADYVKLVDFGIAKPTKGTGNTLTKTGFVLGTPAYMSPEQICADKLDGRTDLYSLGCVLYEMLVGVTPWADDSIEAVMMRRLTEPVPHPRSADPSIPEVLDDVVVRLLARSVDDRFPDARAAADALTAAQEHIDPTTSAASRRRDLVSSGSRARAAASTADGAVEVSLGQRAPRRSRDVVPTAPLSPAIPFASPAPGKTGAIDASAVSNATAPASVARRSRWPAVVAGAAVVIAAGGVFVWQRNSASDVVPPTAVPASSAPATSPSPTVQTPAPTSEATNPSPTAATSPSTQPATPAETKTARSTTKPPLQNSSQTAPGTKSAQTTNGGQPATSSSNAAATNRVPDVGQPPAVPITTVAPTVTETQKQAIAPPVATVDPAIAAAVAADRAELPHVRESVDTWVRGIGSRQVGLLRQVYPSMSTQMRDGWNAMFTMSNDLSAQLVGTPVIVVHGSTGDANFVIEMKGERSGSGNFTQRTSFRAHVQRTDHGWIFSSLDVSAGG